MKVKFTTKFLSKVFTLLASGITTYLNIARHKSYYSIRLGLEIQKSSQAMQARKLLAFSSKSIQPEQNYAIFNTPPLDLQSINGAHVCFISNLAAFPSHF